MSLRYSNISIKDHKELFDKLRKSYNRHKCIGTACNEVLKDYSIGSIDSIIVEEDFRCLLEIDKIINKEKRKNNA